MIEPARWLIHPRELVQGLVPGILLAGAWTLPAHADCIYYETYIHTVGRFEAPSIVYATAVAGDLAFLAETTYGVQVVDVSDPSAPFLVGEVDTPGSAEDIVVIGDYAYVADWTGGLQIIDVSDPMSPEIVGDVAMPEVAQGVAVDGEYVYVAAGGEGLQIVDISNPSSPSIVGGVDTPGGAYKVAVRDGLAFLADSYGGFRVADVADPANPYLVGYVDVDAISVSLLGDLALVGASNFFRIIDISNPTSPVVVGGSETYSGYVPGIVGEGKYAFAPFGQAGFRVFDISNPAAPVWVGGVVPYGTLNNVARSGNYLYLSAGGDSRFQGIEILDISNPVGPSPLSQETVAAGPGALGIDGNTAYVVNSGGLSSVDVSNPADLQFLDQLPIVGGDLEVGEDRVYIASGIAGLKVVGADNPASLYLLGEVATAGPALDLAVSGETVYMAEGDSGLSVIDTSTPGFPLVGRVPASDYATFVTRIDPYVYLAERDSGLVVLDLSVPANPDTVRILSIPDSLGTVYDIEVNDDTLYLSTTWGMVVLDVTDPSSPEFLSGIHMTVTVQHISVAEGFAYVQAGFGFQVFDVSDPAFPRELGHATTRNYATDLKVANGIVFEVMHDFSGFEPTRLLSYPAQCSTPTSIRLDALSGEATPNGIALTWNLFDGDDLVGIHVHRTSEPEGASVRLTSAPLSAAGPQRFLDPEVIPFRTYSYRLEALDRAGLSRFFGPITVRMEEFAPATRLGMSRPNPFRGGHARTTMVFELATAGPVRLTIFDASGRRVRVLLDQVLERGPHTASWDGRDDRGQPTGAGMYFYRLDGLEFSESRPLVRLR